MSAFLREHIKIISELSKIRITIAVSLTTFAGFILKNEKVTTDIILPTLGIFFLACGSSVLNHLQEYRTDALMKRTKNRPLPSKKVTPAYAGFLAVAEIVTGSVLLYFGAGLIPLLLGLLAMLWYNLVYTNLKKKTAYAVIPGSLIGSIPPLVGWTTAGGELFSIEALIIAIFFFIWQIPHFFLLLLKYNSEYENSGFPTLKKKYTESQIWKQIFFMVVLTALAAMLLVYFRLVKTTFITVGIVISSIILLVLFSRRASQKGESANYSRFFRIINLYVLAVVLLICIDHIFY